MHQTLKILSLRGHRASIILFYLVNFKLVFCEELSEQLSSHLAPEAGNRGVNISVTLGTQHRMRDMTRGTENRVSYDNGGTAAVAVSTTALLQSKI